MIKALGIINGAGLSAAVRATANMRDPTARVPAQTVRFQARPGNSGIVYIALIGAQASPTVDSPQILAALAVPAHATQGPFAVYEPSVPNIPAGLNVADFYIIAASGDEVYVSCTAQ